MILIGLLILPLLVMSHIVVAMLLLSDNDSDDDDWDFLDKYEK